MPHLPIFIVLLFLAGAAFSQTPHDRWHDRYQEWKTINGGSCCDNRDCSGADGYRLTPDGYEVQIQGQYFPVPEVAIRPYPSPDGGAHVCYTNGYIDGKLSPTIICFIRPMGV